MQIDGARLWQRLEALARFTDPAQPWTRRAFTDLFLQGRAWLTGELEAAGLEVSVDTAGNLIGRREGRVKGAKPIVTGSHSDTVAGGGRFDGMLGVLAGLEVACALHEHGIALDHPLEIIDFLSEEPSDYGVSCVGSRAISGVLTEAMLQARRSDGETLAGGIRRMGGDPERIAAARRGASGVHGFIELHIEQGPVLEARKLPIGIVSDIVGIRRANVVVEGRADHAGTTPMDIRRDALVGAARVIDAVYELAGAMSQQAHYVVATIGRIAVVPNAPNAVPARVDMVLEVRSDSNDVLDTFPELIIDARRADLQRLNLAVGLAPLTRAAPTDCSPELVELIERSAESLGYRTTRLTSGAGHDAVYMKPLGPMGMIFVPCRQGRSHCPEEWIDATEAADGSTVLFESIRQLDAL